MDRSYASRNNAAGVDIALLVVRVVTGLVFFMHGYQKLFDNGISATQDGFDFMGVPLPAFTAVVVTFVELIGGLLLIAGAYTRILGVVFAIDMIAAFLIVHQENGFFVGNGGFELVLLLAAVSVGFAFAGGGRYSVDELVNLPYSGDLTELAGSSR